MNDTIYSQAATLYDRLAGQVSEGSEVNLPAISIPHYSVLDTGLAACLVTLGVPFRHPAPYTDDVQIDDKGNEGGRRICWWLGEGAPSANPKPHKTDFLLGAWEQRARFQAEHPLHPLNDMRAALEARAFWLGVIHGSIPLPRELKVPADQPYVTDSINGASVLKACGYEPLAFSGRAFYLQRVRNGVHAEQLLASATQEGQSPERWMSRVLRNYSQLVGHTKRSSTIIRESVGDETLLLTADSTRQTRDLFHAQLS